MDRSDQAKVKLFAPPPSSNYRYYNGGAFELHITVPDLIPLDRWIGSRRVYRLRRRFTARISFPGGSCNITVPQGFETDFASFPLPLQLVLGNRDDYMEESIIHDWLYREGVPAFFANSMMRVVMTQLNRKAWKRLAVFYGLMFLGYRGPLSFLWRRNVSTNTVQQHQPEGQNWSD